jgi:type I restriction enzyme S subunit
MKFGLPEDIIESIQKVFEQNSKVDEVLVFGSRAKGNYRTDSDIDLALKGRNISFDDILKLKVKLDELNLPYKIDLIDYNTITEKDLLEHIGRVGISFYKRWKDLKWGQISTIEYGKGLENYLGDKGKFPVYGTNGKIGTTDKVLCPTAGVIIGRKGAYRGIHFSTSPFYVIDTAFYLKLKIKDLDIKYAYYQLLTQDINYMDSGSAIPSTSREDFYALNIKLPPIKEQLSIVSILDSLSDKIDLLHRQNRTLEQLAETVFRQWFVEDAEIENVPLDNNLKTSSGGTPSRSRMDYYSNGTIKWVKSQELQGTFIFDTVEMITDEAIKNSSAKLFPANTVLIAMYGATVGEYGILAEPGTCNQAVCALLSNEEYPYTFLFVLIKFNKENLINMAVGSAQQNISQDLIKELMIPKSKDRIKNFHIEVEPMFEKIKSNILQIKALTQLRDSLLPKLMSGEVRVEMN